jgi:hypothetical protein
MSVYNLKIYYCCYISGGLQLSTLTDVNDRLGPPKHFFNFNPPIFSDEKRPLGNKKRNQKQLLCHMCDENIKKRYFLKRHYLCHKTCVVCKKAFRKLSFKSQHVRSKFKCQKQKLNFPPNDHDHKMFRIV